MKRFNLTKKYFVTIAAISAILCLHGQSNAGSLRDHASIWASTIPSLLPPDSTKVDTSKKVQSLDTVLFDMYGNLRVDDPLYNKKAPWYVPALNIVGQEVLLNLADHYLLNFDWARVGFRSWGQQSPGRSALGRWLDMG